MTGVPAVLLDDVGVALGDVRVLQGVTLAVGPGETVGLVGPSGAGKATLLGVCNGTVTPTRGRATVLGGDLAGLRGPSLRRLRSQVGTVHQQLHLVGPLRVVHNVNAGRLGTWGRARALWSLVRPQGTEQAAAVLESVGLGDRLYDRTDTLSGGQQQRVAVARVLLQRPRLLLCDEPVASLDQVLATSVMASLRELVTTHGCALLVSLHDVDLARRFCDRLVGLSEGRVRFDRPAAEVGPEEVADLYGGDRQTLP